MRGEKYFCAIVNEILDGRNGGANTCVVRDGCSVERDIEIATYEDALPGKLDSRQVFDGLLGGGCGGHADGGGGARDGVCRATGGGYEG